MYVSDENLCAFRLPKNDIKHHRCDILRFVQQNDVISRLVFISTHVDIQTRTLQLVELHVAGVRQRHIVARSVLHHTPQRLGNLNDFVHRRRFNTFRGHVLL